MREQLGGTHAFIDADDAADQRLHLLDPPTDDPAIQRGNRRERSSVAALGAPPPGRSCPNRA